VALTGILAGAQSLFAVLSARWLGPADRGIFAIGISIASFSLLLGSLGVFTGGRVLLSDPRSGFTWQRYWRVIAVLSGGQAVLALVIDIPLWHGLTGARELALLASFAGYCVSMTAASLAREGVHGIGRHLRASISDLLAALTQLGLGLLLNATGRVSVPALLVCGIAGFVVQLLICRASGSAEPRATSPARDEAGAVRQTLKVVAFSLPGLFLAAGQLFVQKGDRLILGIFTRPSDVGIYGAGATIADAAWIIPTSVSVIVLRQVAASRSLQPLRHWRPIILLTTAVAALVLGVVASALIQLLLGDRYAGATAIVWVLCGGSVLFASQQVDLAACSGGGRLDAGAKVTAWGALVLLVLSLALMPHFRGMGAAWASVGAYGWMALLARRAVVRLGRELAGEQPAPTRPGASS